MFTGIIEELGKVTVIVPGSMSIALSIGCTRILEDAIIGDSIAVNGICLTVTSIGNKEFTADVMPETMKRTNLGCLKRGEKVNLERALKLSDRLGGHIVSGHIDGTGVITRKKEEDNARWLTVSSSEEILKYIILKGSVALDGISLTVAYVDETCFRVSLIPLTAGFTTLGSKRIGDIINIECDIFGKYIEKLVLSRSQKSGGLKKEISTDFLRENGFA